MFIDSTVGMCLQESFSFGYCQQYRTLGLSLFIIFKFLLHIYFVYVCLSAYGREHFQVLVLFHRVIKSALAISTFTFQAISSTPLSCYLRVYNLSEFYILFSVCMLCMSFYTV